MKPKTYFLIATVLIVSMLLILQQSCKKEDTPPNINSDDPIVPSTTKVIGNSEWSSSILEVDTSNFTIKAKNDLNLTVGDILVSQVDGGYLRKVTKIEQEGGDYLIETDFASITEAVEKANGSIQQELVVDDSKINEIFLHDGVTINEDALRNSDNTDLYFNINAVLYDFDGNFATTGDQIRMNGHYGMSTTFRSEVEIENFNLEYLKFEYEVAKEKSVDLTCAIGVNVDLNERIARIPFHDIVLYLGIPVTIQPVLEIYAGVALNANAEITTGVSETVDYETSLVYDDNEWTTTKTVTKNFENSPPTAVGNASVTAYLKPVLKFRIYRVLSPKVEAKLYEELSAQIRTIDWELSKGLKIDAGVDMKIWKKTLFDYTFNIIDFKAIIDEGTINDENTAPTASFTVSPSSGTTNTLFQLDASESADLEDPLEDLEVRWDFNGDGSWDTDWSVEKIINYQYSNEGNYNVKLEVKDTQGLTSPTTRSIFVSDNQLLLNLVSFYNFDEEDTFNDLHNNNDGVINGATWTNNGLLNNAYSFDGQNDYISLPGLNNFSEEDYSYSVWIKLYEDEKESMSVFNTRSGHIFYRNNLNYLDFGSFDQRNGTGATHRINEYTFDFDQWYHLVCTVSGNNLNVYINGENVTSNMTLYTQQAQGRYYLAEIGSDGVTNYNKQRFWNGYIDELGVWNRVLTETEVQQLYNNGSGNTYPFD